jgi:hypothetical protein
MEPMELVLSHLKGQNFELFRIAMLKSSRIAMRHDAPRYPELG